jgi:hypothetical protein
MYLSMISSSGCHVNEICTLLGIYTALSGNFVPTFRDNLFVPPSRVKQSKKNADHGRTSQKHLGSRHRKMCSALSWPMKPKRYDKLLELQFQLWNYIQKLPNIFMSNSTPTQLWDLIYSAGLRAYKLSSKVWHNSPKEFDFSSFTYQVRLTTSDLSYEKFWQPRDWKRRSGVWEKQSEITTWTNNPMYCR